MSASRVSDGVPWSGCERGAWAGTGLRAGYRKAGSREKTSRTAGAKCSSGSQS